MKEQTQSILSPVSKHSIFDDLFGSCTPLSGLGDYIATPTELEKVFAKEEPKFKPNLTKLQVPNIQGVKAQRIYSEEYDQAEVDFNTLLGPVSLPSSFEFQDILSAQSTFKLGSVPTQKLKKQKQKTKVETAPKIQVSKETQVVEDPTRYFQKVTSDKKSDIQIKMKTRNEPFKSSIDERLYSSMKYEIKIKTDAGGSKYPCLLARAYLVDFVDSQTIPNALDGVTECAMSEVSDVYEGSLRIQISHLYSYHHTKTQYALLIKFFNPKEVSEEISFASLLSPPFKIFARKPNSKIDDKKEKKRKVREEQISQSQKKTKVDDESMISFALKPQSEKLSDQQTSSEFDEFQTCLEKLLAVKNKLSSQDQIIALNLVKIKLDELAYSEEFQN
eukprot:gene12495-6243_t